MCLFATAPLSALVQPAKQTPNQVSHTFASILPCSKHFIDFVAMTCELPGATSGFVSLFCEPCAVQDRARRQGRKCCLHIMAALLWLVCPALVMTVSAKLLG